MTSSSNKISAPLTAVILYQSQAASLQSHLEAHTDAVFRKSLEIAKYETRHLNPEIPLIDRRLCQFLPRPKGPYPVGFSNFTLVLDQNHNGDKKIGIEIYAPTRTPFGNPLPLHLPSYPKQESLSVQQQQTLHTYSQNQLDPVANLPLIVFSHGHGCLPADYRPLLEEIASHGIAVVCLNHPSSSSYAPDLGELDALSRSDPERFLARMQMLADTQAANISFVVETLRNGQNEELQTLGHAPTIVLAGHSLGGAASIMVSRNNPHIAACINLDGGLMGTKETKTAGLAIPVLTLRSDFDPTDADLQQFVHEWETFHENSLPNSHYETVSGTNHMDFAINPFLGWLTGQNSLRGGLNAHETSSKKILQLMDRFLLN